MQGFQLRKKVLNPIWLWEYNFTIFSSLELTTADIPLGGVPQNPKYLEIHVLSHLAYWSQKHAILVFSRKQWQSSILNLKMV